MNLRLVALNAIIPITKMVGRIHAPFAHKRINGSDFYSVEKHLIPGAILLSYTRGELSNLFIPGGFTHAAIASSSRWVIEAVGEGVRKTDLITFMTTKDRVALLYPKFGGMKVMKAAADLAETCIGSPYDYLFQGGNKAFYCSELNQWCYETVHPGISFKKRERFGVQTVLPSDFIKAKDKWELVWDSDLA